MTCPYCKSLLLGRVEVVPTCSHHSHEFGIGSCGGCLHFFLERRGEPLELPAEEYADVIEYLRVNGVIAHPHPECGHLVIVDIPGRCGAPPQTKKPWTDGLIDPSVN